MAHKKAGGSTRNGRDSESKRLGVKAYGGQAVSAGSIIGMGSSMAHGHEGRPRQMPGTWPKASDLRARHLGRPLAQPVTSWIP